MNPPAEELERRRPVWQAMSALFLDTEIDDARRDGIADALRASGYSESELGQILWGELCPVLHMNVLSVAGVWDGFDIQHVERQILSRPAGRLRQWSSYAFGGRLVRADWQRIKDAMAAGRAGSKA